MMIPDMSFDILAAMHPLLYSVVEEEIAMKLILKILTLPLVIVLTPFTWICFGLLRCSAWIFGLAATLLTVIAVLFALMVSAKDSILLFVLAFLVSPFGVPMLAVHLIGGLYSLNESLKIFIRS